MPDALPVQLRPGPHWLAGQYQEAAAPSGPDEARPTRRRAAVLLCNPFGQEAIRCHRTFRVLAERLAKAGIPSLRFDYSATGDSSGDDGEGNLHLWQHDVVVAHDALRQRAGAVPIVWLGLRLGAAIALDATRLVVQPPTRLILWDPVAKGQDYLEELSACHAFWTRRRSVTTEAMGFMLPSELRQQIASVDLLSSLAACKVKVTIVVGASAPGKEALLSHLRATAKDLPLDITPQTTAWCSNEALGSQLVPTDSVEVVLRKFEEMP